LRSLLRGALDLLLPPACVRCGAAGESALCATCARALPRIPRELCALCQERPATAESVRCAGCAARSSPLDACVAGVFFESDAAAWIRRYKYPPRGILGAGSGRDRARVRALLREALAWSALDAPDCVVPVPLHGRRLRARGFNPAAALARVAASAHGVRCDATALERVRDTPSQTGLGRAARRANVRDAFCARGRVPERVWLVDDVVTTGATLEACARTLRRAGARHVLALCAARTPRDGSDAV
jgi:ComF family protein